TLAEANEAALLINNLCDRKEANIIFGWVADPNMEGQVRVTVLATGFAGQARTQPHSLVMQQPEPQPTSRQLEMPPSQRQPVMAAPAPIAAQPQSAAAPAPAPAPQAQQPQQPQQPAEQKPD